MTRASAFLDVSTGAAGEDTGVPTGFDSVTVTVITDASGARQISSLSGADGFAVSTTLPGLDTVRAGDSGVCESSRLVATDGFGVTTTLASPASVSISTGESIVCETSTLAVMDGLGITITLALAFAEVAFSFGAVGIGEAPVGMLKLE